MMTLARLHAALDSVVETEQLIKAISLTAVVPQPDVGRVATLIAEARERLRALLAPPGHRHAVGNLVMQREPSNR